MHRTTRTRGKRVLPSPYWAAIGLMAVAALLFTLVAVQHAAASGPVSGNGVVPLHPGDSGYPPNVGKNPTCEQLGAALGGYTWNEYKIEFDNQGPNGFKGSLPAGASITVTNVRTDDDGTMLFDWEATGVLISAVFVKQADDAHSLYHYDPPASSDTRLGPKADAQQHDGISHISFCWDPNAQQTPTPTETPTETPTPSPTPTGVVSPTGDLWVKKVVVGSPTDTTAFTVTVTGLGTGLTFSQNAPRSFLGIALGSYTATEGTPPAGYSLLGHAVVASADASCPESFTSGASASVTLTEAAPSATICFYNERLVTPTPTTPSPTPTPTTPSPTPTPTTPSPTPTPTTPPPSPTPTTPPPSPTPTTPPPSATPTTPSPTPTPTTPPPSPTPTTPPPSPTPTTPPPSPTPTETVAGEATPGPTATPVVPRAGSGTVSGDWPPASALVLLGVAIAALGAAGLVLRRSR